MGDNPRAVAETYDRWGLPVTCPSHDTDAIYEAMGHDKKKRGGMLRWVLPREIGVVEIVEDVPPDVVMSALCDLGAEWSRSYAQ